MLAQCKYLKKRALTGTQSVRNQAEKQLQYSDHTKFYQERHRAKPVRIEFWRGTARRTHHDQGVIFDFTIAGRVARHGRDDFGFLARDIAAQIEAVDTDVDQRVADFRCLQDGWRDIIRRRTVQHFLLRRTLMAACFNPRSCSPLVLMAVLASLVAGPRLWGQLQPAVPTAGAPAAGQRAGAAPTRPPAPPEITKANATGQAVEVLAFEEKLDAAVLQGDAATVDKVIAKDFVAIPDDHWTTGGKSKIVEDRTAYLKRVTEKAYLVRDLDQVKIEMHPDLGITYGRYVTLPRSGSGGKLLSTWFQRVYAKRNGQWQLLSERTVHGPTPSPAGVDPTMSDNSPAYGVAPVWFLTDPASPYQARTADEKEIAQMDQKVGTAAWWVAT